MNKIHIITGAPLTGKTEYIKNNFSDSEKYYILDYSKTFLELFDAYDDSDTQKECDVMNKMMEEVNDYYRFGDCEIVFEYCTGFEESDKTLMKIIKLFKSRKIELHLIELTCSVEEASSRNEFVKSDPSYYSSYHLNDVIVEFFTALMGDVQMTEDLTSV